MRVSYVLSRNAPRDNQETREAPVPGEIAALDPGFCQNGSNVDARICIYSRHKRRGRKSGPFSFLCLQAQWLASAFRTAATSAALTGPASLPQALRSQLASSATSSSDMRSA